MRRSRRGLAAATAATAVAALAAAPALGTTSRGPSTTTDPYVVPVADGVHITSLLTVDDAGAAGNGYEMAGIPDGLGAFRPSGGAFDLVMNHELRPDRGIVRRHGQLGAFVSKLGIDQRTLTVRAGEDFISPNVRYWNYVTQSYQEAPSPAGANPRHPASDPFTAQSGPFSRFCSGNLTDPGQLYNSRSGRG